MNRNLDIPQAIQSAKENNLAMWPKHVESRESGLERFRNRSKMSLIANILRVSSKTIARTHLMYRANLSHRMLNSYVAYLINQGLLEEESSLKNGRLTYYRTTKRGQEYVDTYDSLMELAGGLGRFNCFRDAFGEEYYDLNFK
jgi:predicted transcriptional regulator